MKTNKGVTTLKSINNIKNNNSAIPLEIVQSGSFHRIKDQVMKMMDRQDDYLCYRRVDREAVFYSLFNNFYQKIIEKKINVLICSEAPHFPAEYTIYSICEFLNIPKIHFLQSSIAPFMIMSQSIDGNWVKLERPSRHAQYFQKIMHNYVDSMQVSRHAIEEPDYMKKQKSFDERLLKSNNKIKVSSPNLLQRALSKLQKDGTKGVAIAVFRKLSNLLSLQYVKTKLGLIKIENKNNYKRWYTIQSLNFLEEPVEIIVNDSKRNDIKNQIKDLQKSEYSKACKQVSLEEKYVYFPLHYEPERTTNPEGGNYYNTYDALLALRSFIPNEIAIYVKEHYSQFSHALHGHRGRSHYFYRSILSIPNLIIVSMDYSSIELIDNAELTASITGTACLEAACRGRKSLIFGNTWFLGCPNIYKFDQLNNYQDLADAPISYPDQIKEYFDNLIDQYAISGCANPGIEKQYRLKYPEFINESLDEDMLNEIVSALSTVGFLEKDEISQA